MTNLEETLTSSKRLFDGKIINLRLDTVRMPDGKMSKREIVEHRGAVAMVPMLDKETVVLVRQYRRAAAGVMLEIPAGTRDPNEDIEVYLYTFDELKQLLKDNGIVQSMHVTAFFYAFQRLGYFSL